MAASPFAKPFADRLLPWEEKLVRFQEILDQWLKCQGKWLYLEPIFGAAEIMAQIPREGAAFREMDTTWRRIMAQVKDTPLMTSVAELHGLREDLIGCNQALDIVEKGKQWLQVHKTGGAERDHEEGDIWEGGRSRYNRLSHSHTPCAHSTLSRPHPHPAGLPFALQA
jgi:hypothetical protein